MHQHIFNLVKPNKGNQTEKFSKGLQLRPQHGLQKEEPIKLRANFGCSGTFGNASLRDASLCSISCLTGREQQMKVFSCSAGAHSTKEGSVYSSGLPVKGSLNKTQQPETTFGRENKRRSPYGRSLHVLCKYIFLPGRTPFSKFTGYIFDLEGLLLQEPGGDVNLLGLFTVRFLDDSDDVFGLTERLQTRRN